MSHERILVVEDDPAARHGLEKLLRSAEYDVVAVADGAEALELALERAPDVVVTDLEMPRMDGVTLMKTLGERGVDVPVIVTTGATAVSAAVDAMRAGAADFITKPIDFAVLLLAVERAIERRALRSEAENLRRQLRERDNGGIRGLVGTSPAMQNVYRMARQVAGSRATVLVTGESGTGKGELAKAIHALGPRANGPFVALHCASIPETLLEAELFGHERGAFTGADKRRIGKFEHASGGTLFLDEVGEIPMAMQVKLLRVLQERSIERVGGNETIPVDVRLIAATNRDLAREVAEGRFREDLYYRLNVVHVEMPPLRVRTGDILGLANHFLARFASDAGRGPMSFSAEAQGKLLHHRWPGNVRELENAVERAVVLCEGTEIQAHDLPVDSAVASTRSPLRVPGATMAEIERHAILTTLEAVGGSTVRAAEILEISVRTIQYRLAEYRKRGLLPEGRLAQTQAA